MREKSPVVCRRAGRLKVAIMAQGEEIVSPTQIRVPYVYFANFAKKFPARLIPYRRQCAGKNKMFKIKRVASRPQVRQLPAPHQDVAWIVHDGAVAKEHADVALLRLLVGQINL